jgi:hypothetical protein
MIAPEYNAYLQAKTRCNNQKCKSWKNYGGRGIEFRFNSFKEWSEELGPKPSPNLSVDRIDNDGHYERGNLRWATPEQQAANRRSRTKKNG